MPYTLENSEGDPADKCVGSIKWVNRIYDTDWYELYAVSVDSFDMDSGIAVGGTLSAEEQAVIQEAIVLRYGDISSARQALIVTALGQVGAVRYYWRGKPVNAGMPLTLSLNGAGEAALGASCTVDGKGRAVAGLDCFGFVGWAYWTAFGEAGHEYGNLYRQPGIGADRVWGTAAGGYRPADCAGGGLEPHRNLPGAGRERESTVDALLRE